MGNLQLYSSIGFFEVAKNMEDMPSLYEYSEILILIL